MHRSLNEWNLYYFGAISMAPIARERGNRRAGWAGLKE
jgi:hypothetical protein